MNMMRMRMQKVGRIYFIFFEEVKNETESKKSVALSLYALNSSLENVQGGYQNKLD